MVLDGVLKHDYELYVNGTHLMGGSLDALKTFVEESIKKDALPKPTYEIKRSDGTLVWKVSATGGRSKMKDNDLRPEHYKKGEDTFAWTERRFGIEACLIVAAFNIHKYNDRDKGQDYEDFGKIADYALWARSLMEKDMKGK